MNRPLVFVYGTLRKNEKNHRLLEGSKRMASQAWTTGTLLDTRDGYPAMKVEGEESVYGEVYEVDQGTLAALDELEEYQEGGQNNLYDRIEIPVSTDNGTCKAITYVAGERLSNKGEKIEGGDWSVYRYFADHKTAFSYFGYGSCMDNQRDEDALRFFSTVEGVGRLDGYALKFTKKFTDGGRADIVEEQESSVEGKVYRLPLSAKDYLYKREGVRQGMYRPAIVEVDIQGQPLEVLTFIVVNKDTEMAPPDHYAAEILRGAKGFVSENYYEWLLTKIQSL